MNVRPPRLAASFISGRVTDPAPLVALGDGAMPINRLLKDRKVSAEETERLNRAFTFTLKSLHLVDRNDPVCDIVAAKVIEIDKPGVCDPTEIAKLAAKQLGVPK